MLQKNFPQRKRTERCRDPVKSSAPTSASAETASSSVLNKVISATRQTEPDRAEDLVRALVEQASAGVVKFDRNLNQTIERAITQIDQKLSEQLNAIIHHERFLKLEGSWRGLQYLVSNTETSANLKLRMLNVSKRELNRDLTRATEFDQSVLFRKIYESEFACRVVSRTERWWVIMNGPITRTTLRRCGRFPP